MYWEVIVPGDDKGTVPASVTVEADNWFSALRNGLTKHGFDGQLVSNLNCDVKPDRSVSVTDFVTRKVYTLRPLGDKPPVEAKPAEPEKNAVQAPVAPEPAVATAPVVEPSPAPVAQPETAEKQSGRIAGLPTDLVQHNAFVWRDEAPDDGSAIFYRERLIAVAPDTHKDSAAKLALAYFDGLKAMGAEQGTKLFITVQVFDHEFDKRSLRPAIAALTWKEWSPKKTKLQFPLSGDEGIRLSRVPRAPVAAAAPVAEPVQPAQQAEAAPAVQQPVVSPAPVAAPMPEPVGAAAVLSELIADDTGKPAAAQKKAVEVAPVPEPVPAPQPEPAPEPVPLVQEVSQPSPAPEPTPAAQPAPVAAPIPAPEPVVEAKPEPIALTAETAPAPVVAPEPAPEPVVEAKPEPLPAAPVSQPESVIDVDDIIVKAFERMQEIYSVRDHDKTAEFALNLCQEFISCEAGSTMLITPGKYELYVAAARGQVADEIMGKKLSLTKGIVGFATRAGAVITVSDPDNDPRFHDEFDQLSGFKTRNVVCAPIQYEGKTIGAIELINSPREAGFLQTEANVLSYIAGAVGEYIDTSLPSREADFSDRDFHEFLPTKRVESMKRAAAKKGGGQLRAAGAARKKKSVAAATTPAKKAPEKSASEKSVASPNKDTKAGTPKAKKAATPSVSPKSSGGGSKKKKKKKRKR